MDIQIKSSTLQFRNPNVGQPTRAIEEHYISRRIVVNVDGEEKLFRFKKEELKFNASEDDMIESIEEKIKQ